MKKFLSILISVILVLSVMPVASFAAGDDTLKITVANDLHLDLVSARAERVEKTNTISEDYPHASNGGQLYYESEAIIDSFLASAAENDSEYLLLVGDLTHHGTKEEHLAFSEKLMHFGLFQAKRYLLFPVTTITVAQPPGSLRIITVNSVTIKLLKCTVTTLPM